MSCESRTVRSPSAMCSSPRCGNRSCGRCAESPRRLSLQPTALAPRWVAMRGVARLQGEPPSEHERAAEKRRAEFSPRAAHEDDRRQQREREGPRRRGIQPIQRGVVAGSVVNRTYSGIFLRHAQRMAEPQGAGCVENVKSANPKSLSRLKNTTSRRRISTLMGHRCFSVSRHFAGDHWARLKFFSKMTYCPEREVNLRKGVFEFPKDGICRGSPSKRFGFFIVFCEVGINGGLELSHRREASPANGLCSDASEETLDHVEPGTASGSEVKMKAWMT